ncbi:hypothetical protein SOM22_09575 [Stenotrophomonas rhizophila]|uniref:bpX5 domain-containing protein n=1 Tax=Stenotrophomonas rhizophila TaxID=216778 RepID=UPI002A6B318F|nr:hypothetical protein [Stenotrophomonas rhizophila]MDY0954825.1 hypothetical protein [Stenotrophomonas rhizophila]
MRWGWRDAELSAAAQGVIGFGAAARSLLAALEKRPREGLLGVAGDDLLVLAGPTSQLPWVDQVQYIAPCEEAAALWLPTHQRPAVALDLLANALAAQHGAQPLLLLAQPARLIALARLMPVDVHWLQQVRQRWYLA